MKNTVILIAVLFLVAVVSGQGATAKPKKAKSAGTHGPDSARLTELQAKGDLDFETGNLDSALANYLALKSLDPKYPKNDVKIGKIFLSKKQYTKAEKYLTGAVEADAEALRALAQCHLDQKQGKKAIEDYQQLLKRLPGDVLAGKALYLAFEEYKKTDITGLIQAYKIYLNLAPDDKSIQLKCGYLMAKSSDPALREEGFLKILEIRPRDLQYLTDLGKLYMSRLQNDKALPVLIRADSADPGNLELIRLLGTAYGSLGKRQEMAAILEKQITLEKQPGEIQQLHKRLGALYAELKDGKKSLSHYEAYIQANPKDVEVQNLLLGVYREEKNKAREVATLAALIKLEPNRIAHWQARADMEFNAGRLDSALAQYIAIKNMDPEYTANDLRIGRMYFARKEWPQAEKFLSPSAGNDPEALRMLADCLLALKKDTKAIEIYQRLFKEKSSDRELARKIYKMSEQAIVGNAGLLKAYQDYLNLVPTDTIVGTKVDHTLRIMKDVKDLEAYQSRGDLYYSVGDSLCAMRDYLSVYRINMQIAANDMRIASISYAMKDWATAEKFLVRSAGTNKEALKMLEECRKQMKTGEKK